MNINKIPGGYNLELRSCDFLNDTKVKVELRDGVASDRGRCGANPPITLQITSANGERLEFDFSPRCGGLLIESAVIHREYVKVCKYTEVNHKAPWVPEKFASEPGFKCKTY